jgi:hypothetical protein
LGREERVSFSEKPCPKESSMPTIEELISVLLPLLPEAEVTQDNEGQIVIYTGLTMPSESA